MTATYKGLGKLRLQRGMDVTSSVMSVTAFSYEGRSMHGVRLVTTDPLPGGCCVEIVLSPDAAASLASQLHTLARAARFTERQASPAACNGTPLRILSA
jgi:hypothetical protein